MRDKTSTDHVPTGEAALVPLLEAALDLRAVARPVARAHYQFSMENDFVSPTGRLVRQQRFRAWYTRELVDALSPRTALFRYRWTRVEFSSTSADQSRSASQDPIRWTFAEGRTFEYYRPFPGGQLDGSPDDEREATPEFQVGDWYGDMVRLPSVNLLVMATWDVCTFEAMAGVLACDGLGEYGRLRPIPSMDNTSVHLDFRGFSVEDSTFESEAVLGRPAGVTIVAGVPCAGISFQGRGRLEVGRADGADRSQQGESYFLGNCYLSMGDADLASGEMTEQLIVSVKNRSGLLVPMQKRRVVRTTRED